MAGSRWDEDTLVLGIVMQAQDKASVRESGDEATGARVTEITTVDVWFTHGKLDSTRTHCVPLVLISVLVYVMMSCAFNRY